MPGYVIHLAIGKIYENKNNIKDIESFEKGIIDPDLTNNKIQTHYKTNGSKPDLNRYIKEHGINSEYDEGYFLHLASDYLFYNKFIDYWDERIYDDYDILNNEIVDKYKIIIPEIIQKRINPKDGTLTFLNEKDINRFIKAVGNIDYRSLINKKTINCEKEINDIDFNKER